MKGCDPMKHFLIAGRGYIGNVHAECAPIAAHFLVRRDPDHAAGIYDDFDAALKERPLFFDICTPNDSHHALSLQAAQKGLPVYCEKPLAATLPEAENMLQVFTEKELPNGVAFNYRFLPCVHLLKTILQKELLGRIIYYKAAFLHDSYILPRPKAWRMSAAAGGGALADLGIHLFDLCNFVFGDSKLTACEKHIEFPDRTEVDEYARCTLESKTAKGYLEISRISAGRAEENGIEVFGHNGSARILFDRPYDLEIYDIRTKETKIISADADMLSRIGYPDKKHDMGMFYGSHKAAIEAFIRSLDSGIKSDILADFADALKAQKILDAALQI